MQMGSLGVPELLVILVVVLLLFGPKRLPEVSRGLGKAVRDFRKGLEQGLEEVREEKPATPQPEPATTEAAAPEAATPEAAAPAPAPPAAEGGASNDQPAGSVGTPREDGEPPAHAA